MTDYPREQIDAMRGWLSNWVDAADRADDTDGVADAKALLRMSDRISLLGPSQYSDQRHEFLLRRGVHFAEHTGGLAAALEDRDATERIVRWIHQTHENAESNKDYRIALRMFGELATEGEGKPESIEWVPGGYPKNYDPAPDPARMYRWEEHIVPMLDACHNSRDRALIALSWDVGPRPSELFALEVGRFADHKYGMQVTLYGGKQGTRSPILIPSVPYVRGWLQDHPAENDPEAPLWTRKNRPDKISNNRMRDIFKEAVEAAKIKPPSPPTPRRMRKSSASNLASQGVSQAHLEDHHGWTRGSSVASRYIAVFGDANDREIAKAYGIDVDMDAPDPIAPIICPRCSKETPREKPVCVWCYQAVTPTAVEQVKEQDTRLFDSAVKDDGRLADRLERVQRELDELRALSLGD